MCLVGSTTHDSAEPNRKPETGTGGNRTGQTGVQTETGLTEPYNVFFEVILRLSEALVCFRASGDNVLRSITRAILNKEDGKRKIDFLTLFLDFQRLSFFFAPPGITFCARSPGLYLTQMIGNVKLIF